MDRTDLLAAGRKKLQQYRQKKDVKGSGSRGKSSKKSGKSEKHDGYVTSAAAATVESLCIQEGEMGPENLIDTKMTHVDSSVSQPFDDAIAPDDDRPTVSSLLVPSQHEAVGEDVDKARSNSNIGNEHDSFSFVSNEQKTHITIEPDMGRDTAFGTSEMAVSDGESTHATGSSPIDLSAPLSIDEGNVLLSEQDYSDARLTQAREDQEAVYSGSRQLDKISVAELKGDGMPVFSEFAESADILSGAPLMGSTRDTEQRDASIVAGNHSGDLSVALVKPADGVSVLVPEMADPRRENLVVSSSDEEKLDVNSAPGLKDLETKMVNLSVRLTATQREDEGSISLLQLSEVVKRLDEDEFRFLLGSKDSTSNAPLGHTGSLLVPEYDVSEALERYKEQLYLANITKDISILQHMEHCKIDLDYKISMLNASLNESKDTNKCLAEQLSQSQSELQAVTKDSEDLKYKYQTMETEITKFSSKVCELQDELEISHTASSDLSLELSDCKNLVDSLHVENSNVSGSLTLAMEDKINVEEELVKCQGLLGDVHVANSELSRNLVSVTEDWKKLEGSKDYLVCENEKLLSQVEAIEMEKSNFSATLTLMTEEMKKLEEQKHHCVCESDNLRSDLAECHSILKALQVENNNLSEGITFVTDEKRKLEEGKENLIIENKSLYSELCVNQELLSVSQTKNLQLEADRREMNLRFEQLLEQNIMLDCSLDIHKVTIMEIIHMQSQLAFHSREASNQIESRDQISRVHTDVTNDEDSQQISGGKDSYMEPKQLEQNVYSDVSGFPDFNRHLEEADKVIQKLEKAIEEMHSHSASLSRLGGNGTAPGVSKLIQAFETKTHLEDDEVEENHTTEDQSNVDPFRLSKHQTSSLRAVLMELQLDANNASQILQGERNDREVAGVAYTDLNILYEDIREHTEILEATNIELEVQYEAVKQHACNNEEIKRELVVLYESLQQENITLNAQNTDLGKKLNAFNVRINELDNQLGELQLSSEGVASSISNEIDNLRSEAVDKFEAALADHEAMIKELNDLREKNDLAVGVLNKIYENLMEQVIDLSNDVNESETHIQNNEPLDPFNTRRYEHLMNQLGALLGERLHLKLENNKLQTELVSRTKETEELNKQGFDLNVVMKLIEDVEAIINLEIPKTNLDKPIVSRLEILVRFLLQRYTEADERANLAREELGSKLVALSEQQEKVNWLDSLNLSQTNELASLKESLSKAEEAIVAVRSELQAKTVEVELSEQRVSSVREKLSIAVAKGKGLVIQRDNLKQSLSDTSIELEMKDAKIHEVEEKLKMYSEAGERVEALESELSYIRNSATALRESFLLKDSVLQRIEEILEDLELPENFHTRDIIEKVDWLARSVTGNSLPHIDWDHTSSNSGDDLRKKYEEIQGKFYELAEQNEMLEQSLMERNNLVQRWEEVLNRIDMPTQLRSMEPEDRIDWLRSEISEAHQYTNALQQKIDTLENQCETLAVNLEDSHRRLSEAESDLQVATHDKENLSKSLETLTCDLEKLSDQAVQFELANNELQSELTSFQAKLGDASLDDVRNKETVGTEKPDVLFLKKDLEEALSDLSRVKDERDCCMEKHQFLVCESEALNKKMEELQDLLSQEEKKSASAREKLNVAVRKGKSLVQQRDSMKQIIEERNSEVVSLKAENLSLRNHLTETEHHLQEKGHNLVLILNTLGKIDLGDEFNHSDPVIRLKQFGKLWSELNAAVAFSEQESRKSKRAAELLLEELNEVQDRNDILQENLSKAGNELLTLKKNEHADFMALKSVVHEVRGSFFDVNTLLADVLIKDTDFLHKLEANIELCIKSSGANVVGLPLVNAHGAVSSFLQHKEEFLARDSLSDNIKRQEYYDGHDRVEGRRDVEHDLQGFAIEINALKEKIRKHSFSSAEMSEKLTTALKIILSEFTIQTESVKSLKKDIFSFESLEKEKEIESAVLRKNMSLLYDACTNSIMEIESRKAHLFGNSVSAGDVGMKLKSAATANGGHLLSGKALLSSEGLIRTIADGLLMLVKEMGNLEAEVVDGKQMEMKTTISNLQKELQEKDMQKERICMELVSQIREAKASATRYSVDFQSAKNRVEVVEEERASLEQKVKELEDGEATSIELQKRVSSLTDIIASKDQEIESLMQALDEEEVQMGELANKISELEKVVSKKNMDLENLEASKGKAMKKLSVTVNKFDELHNLSDSLLAEVEKLQSQLQDRDSEISFLRQEVTRCTNDVLVASQMSNKMNSEEMHALLIWLGAMISSVQSHDMHLDDLKDGQIHEFKEVLQKQITSVISELEDLRAIAQSKDALLQVERSRVEELKRKGDVMEKSLRQKEVQLDMLKNSPESREEISTSSEIVEVEPLINKWAVPGTSIANKVRSLRKVNNDQVVIDMDPTSSRLEDEEDDKVHGFKSLTTSRIIPRFTRPVTDMIDGLWVSCDRALMRQPALRLGIILYWAVLHALFANFVV